MNKDTLSTILSVGALILACVGIYMASGRKELEQKLDSNLVTINDRLTTSENQYMSVDGRITSLIQQVQKAITTMDERVKQLETRSTEMAKSMAQPKAAEGKAKAGDQPAAAGSYKIKSGDTLGKIAKANNTTTAAIQKANPSLNPKKLKIGQTIKLK
jgi:LysM repeat protein